LPVLRAQPNILVGGSSPSSAPMSCEQMLDMRRSDIVGYGKQMFPMTREATLVFRQSALRFPYYHRRRRRGRIRSIAFAAVAVIALWTIARAALGTGETVARDAPASGAYGTVEGEG